MTDQPAPDIAKLRQIEKDLERLRQKKLNAALSLYRPYAKQLEFHALGREKRERLLRAGNQVGKTLCGAMEAAFHLTGKYPPWWTGRRFNRAVKAWAGSKTGLTTRDGVQKYLMGEPGVVDAQGTGAIPKDCILSVSTARGVADLFDTVQVAHHDATGKKDGTSIVRFKSYDQGREKWQSETLDFIWFDEEPDMDIYSEGLTRITATKGMVYITFTPLKGLSEVVRRYSNEFSPDRDTVVMTIEDALHIDPEERQKVVDGYPAHEREARSQGVPILGSGLVFTTPTETIKCNAISPLPHHWVYLWGIDFGINHPFAAVLMGWDRDADILTVCHVVKMKAVYGQTIRPIDHAGAMLPFGKVPVAWPQDGTARESSGETLASQYKKHGLKMMDEHATFPDGGLSTEAGIIELSERMTTGRFKVFAHLEQWFEEYREYHRDKGELVKINDDLLSATRVAMMMRRYAKILPVFDPRNPDQKAKVRVALDVDFPVI